MIFLCYRLGSHNSLLLSFESDDYQHDVTEVRVNTCNLSLLLPLRGVITGAKPLHGEIIIAEKVVDSNSPIN